MIGNNSLDSHASTSLTVGIITRLLLILVLSGMLSIVFSGVLSIVISCRVSALLSSLTHHTSTDQRSSHINLSESDDRLKFIGFRWIQQQSDGVSGNNKIADIILSHRCGGNL